MNSFKLLNFLKKGDKLFFDVTAEEQLEYISSLKEPQDDFQRSFRQYQCQRFFSTNVKGILLNLGSFFLLPILLCYYFVKGLRRGKPQHEDAIGEFKGMIEIIPESLKVEYSINNDLWFEGEELKYCDLKFIRELITRFYYAPYFLVKAIAKIARYSYTITKRTPRAIIVHDEYSYTSSILTKYCEKRNVEHIDVMHGEKLIYIGNSFFRYHRCYIWGEHYKNLFHKLRAEESQFVIEIPLCFNIDLEKEFREEYYADYKYYLQVYNEKELKSIINSMSFAEQKGKRVVYRPHPRFSDVSLLESIVNKDQIEYPQEVPIVNSIASADNIVGSYSTVLNQAYFSKKKVIFDDVTYLDAYNKLVNLQYIFANKNLPRLSQINNA